MMTKDQEREVLKKIEKLINSTGADSYIEAAFDGCVELAKENISNDFLTSFKERSENAYADKLKAEAAYADLTEVIKKMETKIECQGEVIKQLEEKHTLLADRNRNLTEQLSEAIKKDAAKFDEIQKLNNEIIALKAKLYDLTTA